MLFKVSVENWLKAFTTVSPQIAPSNFKYFKSVFEKLKVIINVFPNDAELHMWSLLFFVTPDSVLDVYRTVHVRVQDVMSMQEAAVYWPCIALLFVRATTTDLRRWCENPAEALSMAIIVFMARKCVKYLTVNLVNHRKRSATTYKIYERIKQNYRFIVDAFDIIAEKLLLLYPLKEICEAYVMLNYEFKFGVLFITNGAPVIREINLDELIRSNYCRRFRKKLNRVKSSGELLLDAPDLNSCSLCNQVFISFGVAVLPFVIVDNCSHLFCIRCIQDYFTKSTDTICDINGCIGLLRFWITRSTFENYKASRKKKLLLVPTCVFFKT